MKKAVSALPENYQPLLSIDLQQNKKLAILINGIALLIGAVMAVAMHFVVPIQTLYDMSAGLGIYSLRFGILILALIAYMVLHELVHGVSMKLFGTKKIKYGFTGLYAYAGSADYYGKGAYIVIALAPIVVWGIVLGVVNALVPIAWFWVVYVIQIVNISGAAGDLFVTFRLMRMPRDILVKDAGVSMVVYGKASEGSDCTE